jgi:hypothetical protein
MSISESYSADSRTALAADRTIFAAERTYVPGCGPVLRHAPKGPFVGSRTGIAQGA